MADIITRVNWEPENDKVSQHPAVDEIVTGPCSVHLERMNDGSYWMSFNAIDNPMKRRVVWFYREGKQIVARLSPVGE